MRSKLLEDKLTERRALLFASSLRGTFDVEVVRIAATDFTAHRKISQEHCALDATPLRSWPSSVDDAEIVETVCTRLFRLGSGVFIPFETPFIIKVRVIDCSAFLRSLWTEKKSRDVTLYLQNPFGLIEVQDLEYQVNYFEITESALNNSQAIDPPGDFG